MRLDFYIYVATSFRILVLAFRTNRENIPVRIFESICVLGGLFLMRIDGLLSPQSAGHCWIYIIVKGNETGGNFDERKL